MALCQFISCEKNLMIMLLLYTNDLHSVGWEGFFDSWNIIYQVSQYVFEALNSEVWRENKNASSFNDLLRYLR